MTLVHLAYLSEFCSLLPLTAAIIYYRTLNRTLRVLFIYFILSFISEAIGLYTAHNKLDNSFYFTLYSYAESVLVLLAFQTFSQNRIIKRFIPICIGILLFCCPLFFWLSLSHEYPLTLFSIVILSLCVNYYFNVISELNIPRISAHPYFWLVTALLLYFGTSIFLTLYENYVRNLGQHMHSVVWAYHNVLNIAYNILLSISVWKARTK